MAEAGEPIHDLKPLYIKSGYSVFLDRVKNLRRLLSRGQALPLFLLLKLLQELFLKLLLLLFKLVHKLTFKLVVELAPPGADPAAA